MIPFLALVRKDLRLFFNDRRAVVVGLVVPIALASFFGYIFGGQRGKNRDQPNAGMAIDQDRSAIRVASSRNWRRQESRCEAIHYGRRPRTVRKGKATVAIVVPKDFGIEADMLFLRRQEAGDLFTVRSFALHRTGHGAGNPEPCCMQAVSRKCSPVRVVARLPKKPAPRLKKTTRCGPQKEDAERSTKQR